MWLIYLWCLPFIRVQSMTKLCEKDSDCTPGSGKICVRKFEPCDKGKCACPARQVFNNGKCVDEMKLNNDCTNTIECANTDNAICKDKKCVCRDTHKPKLGVCLKHNQLYLGEPCNNKATCMYVVKVVGFEPSPAPAWCVNGTCRCPPDKNQEADTCRKRKIGGSCVENTECRGLTDAVCEKGVCRCKTGYKQVNPMICRQISDIGDGKAGEFCKSDGDCQGPYTCRRCYQEAPNRTCILTSVCPDHMFGELCNKPCKCADSSEVCNKITGACTSGFRENAPVGKIIGGVIGGIVGMAVLTAIVVYLLKRKGKESKVKNTNTVPVY